MLSTKQGNHKMFIPFPWHCQKQLMLENAISVLMLGTIRVYFIANIRVYSYVYIRYNCTRMVWLLVPYGYAAIILFL